MSPTIKMSQTTKMTETTKCETEGCIGGRAFQIKDKLFCSPRCGNVYCDLSPGDKDYWPTCELDCDDIIDKIKEELEETKKELERQKVYIKELEKNTWCQDHLQVLYKDGLKCGECLEEEAKDLCRECNVERITDWHDVICHNCYHKSCDEGECYCFDCEEGTLW